MMQRKKSNPWASSDRNTCTSCSQWWHFWMRLKLQDPQVLWNHAGLRSNGWWRKQACKVSKQTYEWTDQHDGAIMRFLLAYTRICRLDQILPVQVQILEFRLRKPAGDVPGESLWIGNRWIVSHTATCPTKTAYGLSNAACEWDFRKKRKKTAKKTFLWLIQISMWGFQKISHG